MDIQGAGSVPGPDPVRSSRVSSSRSSELPAAGRPEDRAEISELARLKALLQKVPDIRHENVARIRAEIEAGTYETPEKLARAIERLLEEI